MATPHILDVHPNFSIPAKYSEHPLVLTANEAGESGAWKSSFLDAVQECQTPQESEQSFAINGQELSARLESLAESQSKVIFLAPLCSIRQLALQPAGLDRD